MDPDQRTRHLIVRLLNNIGSAKEIRQYVKRFSNVESSRFAVVKVGGAVLRDDLDALADSLSFLHRVGLLPIVLHGGGLQLDAALQAAAIENQRVDGLRFTSPEALSVIRRVLQEENLRLVEALDRLGTRARTISGGVFEAELLDEATYGLVGKVSRVDLQSVHSSVKAKAVPVLTCLGETPSGQILNINADAAANELVRAVSPFKVVFLTSEGGLLNGDGEVIPSINLRSDYHPLMQADWVRDGMRVKLEQLNDLLADLPGSSSVSITRPAELAKELFTHTGSGTLVRRGERINVARTWDEVDIPQLRGLLESAFERTLTSDYFDTTDLLAAYVAESGRAAAVLTECEGVSHLDKFAVGGDARGEGLGRAVWDAFRREHDSLVWRARRGNPINDFYFHQADGCVKGETWNVFWVGLRDLGLVARCVENTANQPATLI